MAFDKDEINRILEEMEGKNRKMLYPAKKLKGKATYISKYTVDEHMDFIMCGMTEEMFDYINGSETVDEMTKEMDLLIGLYLSGKL